MTTTPGPSEQKQAGLHGTKKRHRRGRLSVCLSVCRSVCCPPVIGPASGPPACSVPVHDVLDFGSSCGSLYGKRNCLTVVCLASTALRCTALHCTALHYTGRTRKLHARLCCSTTGQICPSPCLLLPTIKRSKPQSPCRWTSSLLGMTSSVCLTSCISLPPLGQTQPAQTQRDTEREKKKPQLADSCLLPLRYSLPPPTACHTRLRHPIRSYPAFLFSDRCILW